MDKAFQDATSQLFATFSLVLGRLLIIKVPEHMRAASFRVGVPMFDRIPFIFVHLDAPCEVIFIARLVPELKLPAPISLALFPQVIITEGLSFAFCFIDPFS